MAFDALNKLNYRQRAFLTAYLSNGQDAPSAVIAAGYSEKGATQKGNSLLNTPAVKEAWADLSGELSKKQLEVIDELNTIWVSNKSHKQEVTKLSIGN